MDLERPEEVVGRRVAELRKTRGWSQIRLASEMREAGYAWSQTVVAKTELAGRPIRIDEVVALARLFSVPPAYLLGEPAGSDDLQAQRKMALNHLTEITTLLSDAEDVYKEARSAYDRAARVRRAASERLNALQEAARQAEGSDGGEHREEA